MPKPSITLDSSATFVITGVVDGLGRAVCNWMVERGARSLLLLLPAGPEQSSLQEIIDNFTSRGVKITTRPCDEFNAVSLEQVIADCSTTLPPIKGCVQCTVVKKVR